MRAEPMYQFVLVGTSQDRELLAHMLGPGNGRFELNHSELDDNGFLSPTRFPRKADVVVIAGTIKRPLPAARQVRALAPGSQVLFLLPPDRLDAFRASLPFVPDLASAWTASTAADPSQLRASLDDAAHVARQRQATAIVLGRINDQLAKKTAPAEARRSQLALSERYLATILTQSPDALVAVTRSGTVIAHNDAAANFFAVPLEPGQTRLVDLFPPGERSKLHDLLTAAAQGNACSNLDFPVEFEGGLGHAELSLAPVRDEGGTVASVSITARDITDRKRAEEHQRLLINELNHRVKNTLAIVQSLAQQSFKGAASPAEEMASFGARLAALAAAHNLLTREAWKTVSLGQVVEATLGACGAEGDRYEVDGPAVTLSAQTAVSVTLALHELCTNAIKYGALSNDTGRITARWQLYESAGATRLQLEWIESGGPPVQPPTRRGFGSRMIERGLAAELSAEVRLDYAPQGLVCVIDAPLPEATS